MNKQELKNLGFKITTARMKLLDLLQSAQVKHWSAEGIYRQLLAQGDNLSLATIYRILTQFHEAGLLKRHHFANGHGTWSDDTHESEASQEHAFATSPGT